MEVLLIKERMYCIPNEEILEKVLREVIKNVGYIKIKRKDFLRVVDKVFDELETII